MAWFLVSYKIPTNGPRAGMANTRVLALDDYTPLILADGGAWDATEVLGNKALAKVRASDATLTTIAADPLCVRLPFDTLDTPLASLPLAARQRLQTALENAGYTLQEITNTVGDLSTVTARDALTFFASRRRKPRFDSAMQQIVFDGAVLACRSVLDVDRVIT